MSVYKEFKQECRDEIASQGSDVDIRTASSIWMNLVNEPNSPLVCYGVTL